MNKKLFTQIWNERGHNISLLIELLLVSVVMWYVVDMLYVRASTYLEPRGFNTEHCYQLNMGLLDAKSPKHIASRDSSAAISEDIAELMNRLKHRPEIEAVSMSRNAFPYNGNNSSTTLMLDTMRQDYWLIFRYVSPDFFRVFRYRGARGETSEQLAKLLNNTNVLMASDNCFRKYKKKMTDFIGREFTLSDDTTTTYKLVASLQTIRYSDYEQGRSCYSIALLFPQEYYEVDNELCVRVRENMDHDFIDGLKKDSERLRVGNVFIADTHSFADIRHNFQLSWSNSIRNFILGASFLLINVFLGLLGTFWFRTQRRRSEIALHKALGATDKAVVGRIISESLLLLSLATIVAIIIDVNLAFAELNQYHNGTTLEPIRFVACVVISYLLMTGMILLGIWFPTRKAMKVQPAEALHEE